MTVQLAASRQYGKTRLKLKSINCFDVKIEIEKKLCDGLAFQEVEELADESEADAALMAFLLMPATAPNFFDASATAWEDLQSTISSAGLEPFSTKQFPPATILGRCRLDRRAQVDLRTTAKAK